MSSWDIRQCVYCNCLLTKLRSRKFQSYTYISNNQAVFYMITVAKKWHMISFLNFTLCLFSFVIFVLFFYFFYFVHFVFILYSFCSCSLLNFSYTFFSSKFCFHFISLFEMRPRENHVAESWYFVYARRKAMKQVLLFIKKYGTRLALFWCYKRLKWPPQELTFYTLIF